MKLNETKVKQLIELMNSTTEGKIPPQEPILDCFDMAMDGQMLDYLLAVGTQPHTIGELKALYSRMYAPDAAELEAQWPGFW